MCVHKRGHEVIVMEAANEPGGQIRLLSQNPRRRELLSIIDWRMRQCLARQVTFEFNVWADVEQVLAHQADIVIVATGGLPNTEVLNNGNELVISTWDIISGDIKPGKNVLVFDDAGDHAALQATETIANTGARVELMTPDRTISPDVLNMNLTAYMRELQDKDVTFTIAQRLEQVTRDDGLLKAGISSDFREDLEFKRSYDQIVINHGTIPLDELYFELRSQSSNQGQVDYDALIEGRRQSVVVNPDNRYQLFRIGDAVSARNIHAAVYDGMRLCKDL